MRTVHTGSFPSLNNQPIVCFLNKNQVSFGSAPVPFISIAFSTSNGENATIRSAWKAGVTLISSFLFFLAITEKEIQVALIRFKIKRNLFSCIFLLFYRK